MQCPLVPTSIPWKLITNANSSRDSDAHPSFETYILIQWLLILAVPWIHLKSWKHPVCDPSLEIPILLAQGVVMGVGIFFLIPSRAHNEPGLKTTGLLIVTQIKYTLGVW